MRVTGSSAMALPGHQPPRVAAQTKPPGVVSAAAVVTWVVSTGTAALTLLLTVGLLWVVAPVFDTFGSGQGNPRWWLVGAAAVVVSFSAAADVAAVFVLRGHRWARWVLIGLSVLAALGGVVSAYYVVPLVVTAAAMVVVVLLLFPDAREWFRASHMPHWESAH